MSQYSKLTNKQGYNEFLIIVSILFMSQILIFSIILCTLTTDPNYIKYRVSGGVHYENGLLFNYAPFKEVGVYCFAHVGRSVSQLVSRS